jgi:hypothetical protein
MVDPLRDSEKDPSSHVMDIKDLLMGKKSLLVNTPVIRNNYSIKTHHRNEESGCKGLGGLRSEKFGCKPIHDSTAKNGAMVPIESAIANTALIMERPVGAERGVSCWAQHNSETNPDGKNVHERGKSLMVGGEMERIRSPRGKRQRRRRGALKMAGSRWQRRAGKSRRTAATT